ncbi:ABC transporter permease [Leucobacter massiliensis]|uniref:ABC transporter permease n=1 Tax=Leucobacter massiliensis TaxID=1686285 RepID=A0A2S9QNS5_9MICO|nr:ABC transporter permease [Leucobacter massiliensis]PRI11229.1 ABC transporter permease [Leucobacter massiliensis]
MSRVSRSLSSEWRKVRSTKLWWILAIVLAAYSAMMAGMFGFVFGAMADALGETQGGGAAAGLPPQDTADLVYSTVSALGYAVPLLLGALMATGEMRHRTLALTFVLEPRRGIVLLSKTIVLLGFGILLGIAGLAGAFGAGATVLAATGGDPMLDSGETWLLALRVLGAIGLWAIIGFGIGVLVRNQAFAIVLALVFTQFVEPVLRTGAQFWEWSAQIAKFLPGAATDAFVGASVMSSMSNAGAGAASGVEPLGIGAGLLVLLAYAVLTVGAGWALRWRRDVI